MARRTPGERLSPAQRAAAEGQQAGLSPTQALDQYRALGGTIRTQDWYRIWKAQQDMGDQPEGPPVIGLDPTRVPKGWYVNVQVTYWDTREQGERHRGRAPVVQTQREHWHSLYFPGAVPPAPEDAIDAALAEPPPMIPDSAWEQWDAIGAAVHSYQPTY